MENISNTDPNNGVCSLALRCSGENILHESRANPWSNNGSSVAGAVAVGLMSDAAVNCVLHCLITLTGFIFITDASQRNL